MDGNNVVNNVVINMLHTAAASLLYLGNRREFPVLLHSYRGSRAKMQNINVVHCESFRILPGRYRSRNIGGCIVMSAVQQRVLLLRHCLEEEGG